MNIQMFYPADHRPVNSSLGGQYLARNQLPLVKRAFLGADLARGRRPLGVPTVRQSAWLARVSPTYVHHAIRQEANRAEIEARLLPLVPPKSSQPANDYPLPVITSAEIDDAQVVDFVRRVGVSRVIDAAVAVEAAQ